MDAYLDDFAALDPLSATYLGIPGHDGELPDLSPDGLAELAALGARTRTAVAAADPVDSTDRITQAAAIESLDQGRQLLAGQPSCAVAHHEFFVRQRKIHRP